MVTKELLDYIAAQTKEGLTRADITSILLDNGWKQADVDEAFSKTVSLSGETLAPIMNSAITGNPVQGSLGASGSAREEVARSIDRAQPSVFSATSSEPFRQPEPETRPQPLRSAFTESITEQKPLTSQSQPTILRQEMAATMPVEHTPQASVDISLDSSNESKIDMLLKQSEMRGGASTPANSVSAGITPGFGSEQITFASPASGEQPKKSLGIDLNAPAVSFESVSSPSPANPMKEGIALATDTVSFEARPVAHEPALRPTETQQPSVLPLRTDPVSARPNTAEAPVIRRETIIAPAGTLQKQVDTMMQPNLSKPTRRHSHTGGSLIGSLLLVIAAAGLGYVLAGWMGDFEMMPIIQKVQSMLPWMH